MEREEDKERRGEGRDREERAVEREEREGIVREGGNIRERELRQK